MQTLCLLGWRRVMSEEIHVFLKCHLDSIPSFREQNDWLFLEFLLKLCQLSYQFQVILILGIIHLSVNLESKIGHMVQRTFLV